MHRIPSPVCVAAFAAVLMLAGSVSSPAQTIKERIAEGDACELALEPQKALEHYLPALEQEPENVKLLVRVARQYRNMMTDAGSKKEKLRLAELSLAYAKKAAALAPEDCEAQLSPAISYGKMLPLQGSKEQVEASPLIKQAADASIGLNPNYDLAWHVLGRWHQRLAGVSSIKRSLGSMLYGKLPETTHEQAVACFEKAIALNPNSLRHYIELGRTYAEMGRAEDAKKMIEKGLAMPILEKDDPDLKDSGREMLSSLN